MKIKYIVFNIFFLVANMFYGQQGFGGHPRNQNWQVINTPAVKVIHPYGMTFQAERIARIINYMNKHNKQSVGQKSKQFDLVLQTQTTNPNGYVGMAPLRSEFFSTPPQSNLSLGSLEWLDVLSIHEYRHVLQNLNAKNGIVNLFYYLGGESYWAGLNRLVLPNWYFEGDAVITETALTEAGRGRSPYFTIQQRALIHENIEYSYIKHRNGSYKDLLPNHYPLGYMMLTYLKNNYGNNITTQVLKESTAFKGLIYPFSKAIKRNTNLKGTKDLYQKSWSKFKIDTNFNLRNTTLIPTSPISKNNSKTITSYNFPILVNDSTVITRKKSYDSTDKIVRIVNKKEEKITSIGINNDDFLSYNKHILAWTETTRSPRRGLQDFSDVILFDLKTNKKTRLTKHTRYFSPSISPDGEKVAVINISVLEKFNINILDLKTGKVIKTFQNKQNSFLSRTCWTKDGQNIITIQKQNGKLCIVKTNVESGKKTELIPWTKHSIESPCVNNDYVYYNASYSGIDNIFKTNLNGNKKIYQVSSVPVGAFQPNVLNQKIVFSEFTTKGYQLSEQLLSNSTTTIKYREPVDMKQYKTVANQKEGGNILKKIDSTTYVNTDYKGIFTGLKLHTWGVIPTPSVSSINIRAVNILNDLAFNLNAEINHNENNNIIYNGNIVFSRFFPELTLTTSNTNRTIVYENNSSEFKFSNFNESNLGLKIGIPFTWYKGNYINNFHPYLKGSQFILNHSNSKNKEYFTTYNTGLTYSSIRRTAFQNIGPRAGFSFSINQTSDIKNSNNANKFSSDITVYLPGVSKNHNIRIRGAFQSENLKNKYKYSDFYIYPRGYSTPLSDQFKSIHFNYGIPVAYPDIGFGGLIYVKRIKANLFYDYGVGELKNNNFKPELNSVNYKSTGVELLFDNEYFNVLPISAGLRYSHLLDNNIWGNNSKNKFQFILGTNLSF